MDVADLSFIGAQKWRHAILVDGVTKYNPQRIASSGRVFLAKGKDLAGRDGAPRSRRSAKMENGSPWASRSERLCVAFRPRGA